jgi:hypothetical protein
MRLTPIVFLLCASFAAETSAQVLHIPEETACKRCRFELTRRLVLGTLEDPAAPTAGADIVLDTRQQGPVLDYSDGFTGSDRNL